MSKVKKPINKATQLTDTEYLQDKYDRVNTRTHDLMSAQNSLIDSLNSALKSIDKNAQIMINTLNENKFEFMMDDYYEHQLKEITPPLNVPIETEDENMN